MTTTTTTTTSKFKTSKAKLCRIALCTLHFTLFTTTASLLSGCETISGVYDYVSDNWDISISKKGE